MSIAVVFDPPTPADPPAAFNTKAFDTVSKLNTWSTQANTLADEANTDAATATTQAALAKDWATKTGGEVVVGQGVSAKQSALDAAAQVALAAAQADLATTNGAAQVALAAQQADLATTNGAAQVALAAQQADLATLAAATAQATANFKGEWSALTGPLAKPAAVRHKGLFWVLLNGLANVASSEPSVTADWAEAGVSIKTYPTYAALAALTPSDGQYAIVADSGLFRFDASSTEPVDTETCVAPDAGPGRWLLELPHADLLAAWALPDDEVATDSASVTRRILTASAPCALTTIAAVSKASFTAAVARAKTGAAAFATPLADLDARLAVSARVTDADTVTVTLNNPSADASAANGIPSAWQIFVFNQE